MALTIHGVQPSNVFRLCGPDENSATFALGWVLEQSPAYRKLVVEDIFGEGLSVDKVVIALQRPAKHGGYTDLEIQAGRQFHAILEAKRDWQVPSVEQFKRYRPRLVKAGAERKRLVSVSAADKPYARRRLPAALHGIGLAHLSWTDLKQLAERAQSLASRPEEKLWLRQWIQHLQEFVSMERQTDNNVFVVALSSRPRKKGTRSGIEAVVEDKCYYHPVGKGWPTQPPNYIGFRYDGKLQSVHHIESFKVVENLATHNPLWPKTKFDHFVYRLGRPMLPPSEVKAGKIYQAGHVRCAIDTLLSGAFKTLSDAAAETKRRLTG